MKVGTMGTLKKDFISQNENSHFFGLMHKLQQTKHLKPIYEPAATPLHFPPLPLTSNLKPRTYILILSSDIQHENRPPGPHQPGITHSHLFTFGAILEAN